MVSLGTKCDCYKGRRKLVAWGSCNPWTLPPLKKSPPMIIPLWELDSSSLQTISLHVANILTKYSTALWSNFTVFNHKELHWAAPRIIWLTTPAIRDIYTHWFNVKLQASTLYAHSKPEMLQYCHPLTQDCAICLSFMQSVLYAQRSCMPD